jgi:hypothetical protein
MGRFSKARIRSVRTIVKTEVVVCFVVFSRHFDSYGPCVRLRLLESIALRMYELLTVVELTRTRPSSVRARFHKGAAPRFLCLYYAYLIVGYRRILFHASTTQPFFHCFPGHRLASNETVLIISFGITTDNHPEPGSSHWP